MTERLVYTGIKKSGAAGGGAVEDVTPASLTERLYYQGWRTATIRTSEGAIVGEITRRLDAPRWRTWWAER
ncbi:hypothetical protein [Mycobacteroides abscessus]|uniref:hypothetical protein n=1 Tax=Mycobacteriaceae TaxID=1762 RepID=UPI0034E8651C